MIILTHGCSEINICMAGGDIFCHTVLSAHIYNLGFDVAIRQGQGNNPLDPDQAKLVTGIAFTDMEDQDRGQDKGKERNYLCHYFQSPVNSRYPADKLPPLPVQMDIKDRKYESACTGLVPQDGRIYHC